MAVPNIACGIPQNRPGIMNSDWILKIVRRFPRKDQSAPAGQKKPIEPVQWPEHCAYIRWISRSGDCDSCGMILPATAEHLGYQNAKRNGQIKVLDGGKTLAFDMEAGWLDAERAKEVIAAKGLM